MTDSRLKFWLFFLLKVDFAGVSDVVGHEPVQASAGDDVILPCHLDPPFDVRTLTVEWIWNGFYVHLYTNRRHDNPQAKQFKGRTSMFQHEMFKGNISLKLTKVTEEDAGVYICNVPNLKSQVKRGDVSLSVYPQKDPGGRGGDNETPDDKKPTKDAQTGVIVSSVVGALLFIIAVSAVMFFYIKRWRNNQGNNPQGGQEPSEEMNRMNPPAPSS